MKYTSLLYSDIHVRIDLSEFSPSGKIAETHAIVSVSNMSGNFANQLKGIWSGVSRLLSEPGLKNNAPVFARCFLSDCANQFNDSKAILTRLLNVPVSYVQQPPLDGSKIALWIQFHSNVTRNADFNYAFEHNGYTHLFTTAIPLLSNSISSFAQTETLLLEYESFLKTHHCSIADNCLRTWFFARDIDSDYEGVVKARKENFDNNGLTKDTHYITSTGIQGSAANHQIKVLMDAYAVKGIEPDQIQYLYALDYLSPTYNYGVTFERGVAVIYGDRRKVYISGTASIDNQGNIVHIGNVEQQVYRMWENVEALLREADCTFDDICQSIVYLRDFGDYQVVKSLFQQKFNKSPYLIVFAPVCRPGWLVEMECIAIKEISNSTFRDF